MAEFHNSGLSEHSLQRTILDAFLQSSMESKLFVKTRINGNAKIQDFSERVR